jgi:hypothetical protein
MTNTIEEALSEAVSLLDDLMWLIGDKGATRALLTPDLRDRIKVVRDDLTTITTFRPVSHIATTTDRIDHGA